MLNKKQGIIFSPADGEVIPLECCKDEAFAAKLVGDGVALNPSNGDFRSPVNGRVIGVAAAKHAYSFETDDGMNVLLHIGIDTVELDGEGFSPAVKADDSVAVGDPVCSVDIDYIKSKGYSVCTPVVICNPEKAGALSHTYGNTLKGEVITSYGNLSQGRD